MDDQPQAQASNLRQLVTAKFQTLGVAEEKMLDSVSNGVQAICGPNSDDKDKGNDPKDADNWGPERQIRSELLAWLCTNEQARKSVHPRGIQVYGADVIGTLDLSFVSVPFQLAFRHCRLNEGIDLRGAEVSHLDLEGDLVRTIIGGPSQGKALTADGINVKGCVLLKNGFTALGEVRLLNAHVGGDLDCLAGAFANVNGQAFTADGINVEGSVFLKNGFAAFGEVRLLGAQIGGTLECDGGTFTNQGADALSADGINVGGDVFVSDGFAALGKVRLLGAQIGGDLNCDAGTFINERADALIADRINVKGDVYLLRRRFQQSRRVCAQGATRDLYENT